MGPAQIEKADRWFQRHGEPAVLFGRMIPVVRAFVSLPAGIARMPLVRFTVFTLIGSMPWVLALALAGEALGSEWKTARKGFEYVDYVIVALIVVGIVYADRAPPAGTQAPRHRCGGLSGRCRYDTPSPWACCRGRRSCCRSPPRPTPRCCRGSPVGPTPSSMTSCARRFEVALHVGTAWRSRSTGGTGAGRRREPALGFAAGRAGALARAPGGRGTGPRRDDRAPPRRPALDRRWHWRRGRPGCSPPSCAAGRPRRGLADAGAGDGLALGLAQAVALIPGVSRSGATLGAARWRGSPARTHRRCPGRGAAGDPGRGATAGAAVAPPRCAGRAHARAGGRRGSGLQLDPRRRGAARGGMRGVAPDAVLRSTVERWPLWWCGGRPSGASWKMGTSSDAGHR